MTPTDGADTGGLGALTVVGGLVGMSFVDVEVGTEVVGSDGEVGADGEVDADGEFVCRVDGGADDAGVDVGAPLGPDVVVSELRDVGVGVPDGGLVGVLAGAGSAPPGTGTAGAVGPPSRLTTSMSR
ncbi:MAG TPA: hypothetical protein VGS60_05675 [Actinomycetes bacterium]|nr:hypothetical protein [Actinomycetes bacterium]